VTSYPISGGINADAGYWDGLACGQFRLPRCSDCGRWRWPANWRCAACGGWDQEWVAVEPVGQVYSWTRSWMAFDRTSARNIEVPYVVVLAEVAGAGKARVLGVLGGNDEGMACGRPITGHILPPSPQALGYPSLEWRLA
jgi:uncharacterized protein